MFSKRVGAQLIVHVFCRAESGAFCKEYTPTFQRKKTFYSGIYCNGVQKFKTWLRIKVVEH